MIIDFCNVLLDHLFHFHIFLEKTVFSAYTSLVIIVIIIIIVVVVFVVKCIHTY